MKRTFRRRGAVLAAALVLLCAVSFADRGGPASFAATGWALLPPAVAIVLAFATKEVYSSLLAGCVVGALLTEGFAPWRSFETLFLTLMEGIDLKIFFFDVLLGAIVVLFARSGGSRAFGEWASRRVRSRRGAVTATAGLGCLIFLDDYFNCLTVGAIMQPITDRCRVSREKLSFIIDATAAPVCILAPISSWAAAVSSYIPADYSHVNGFALFIQAIPYNFYALLMLWLVFLVALTGRDFGPMYRREQLALRQEPPRSETAPEGRDRPRGRAVDLLLPTACLIVAVVWGMAVLGRRLHGVLSAGPGAGKSLGAPGHRGCAGNGAGVPAEPGFPAAGRGGGMKRLPVPFIGQGQDLPTGCESVSAAMVLQYLGFSVTAEEFAREWLPRGRFYRDENGVRHGPDPRRAFVGDPHDPEALGCWASAVQTGLSRFLAAKSRDGAGTYRVKNETGAELGYLCRRYIDRDLPVLLWVSIDLRPTVNGPWYRLEPGGEPFMWISNEHCVVLAGYDREHYICCDPWKDRGMAAWPRETVWQRHRELGMQAVALEGPV